MDQHKEFTVVTNNGKKTATAYVYADFYKPVEGKSNTYEFYRNGRLALTLSNVESITDTTEDPIQ